MDCESKAKGNESCGCCGKEGVKYRCPSCLRRTCSLQCVKDHKDRFSCTGVRSKTRYVAKGDYNENNLISDYRFLEDTERVAYTAHSNEKYKTRHFNRYATNLLKKSHASGVKLKLMPVGMKKRKLNTSFYDNRAKRIMWRVQWIFPQADAEYIDKRVSENDVITDLLKKYLDPDKSDPVVRQRLKIYFQTDISKICVLLKKEYQPANQEKFYLLDTSRTLQQNLAEKTVIEFPILHVVLPDHLDKYPTDDTQTRTQDSNGLGCNITDSRNKTHA